MLSILALIRSILLLALFASLGCAATPLPPCGLTGLEGLIPFALLLLSRRLRNG